MIAKISKETFFDFQFAININRYCLQLPWLNRVFLMLAIFFLLFLTHPCLLLAQQHIHIDIFGPGQERLNIFIGSPRPLKGVGEQETPHAVSLLEQTIRGNLHWLPFLSFKGKTDLLQQKGPAGVKGSEIDFNRFRLSQIDLLLTVGWRRRSGSLGQVEVRAFDVYMSKLILGRGYVLLDKNQVLLAANRFCAELMKLLTGKSGFFRSKLAFVGRIGNHKEIFTVTPQGNALRQLTKLSGICLSPAWAWDGERLAFVRLTGTGHELLVWDKASGQAKEVYLPGNTIISPTFAPGGQLVVSIDPKGNPDIYSLKEDYSLDKALVQNWAIDISPDFDKTGQLMVFVSSRLGNPNIFLLDSSNRQTKRISYEGTYNTNPAISPSGRYIAYSRLTSEGHRIIVFDQLTGMEKQVTFGPGNDEDPAWGPDSYFLVFASNRKGFYQLYLTTRKGGDAKQISTGNIEANAPAWNYSFSN